jgi:hypothetical protein
MTHTVVPLTELIAALPELTAGDSKWNQASRDWDGRLGVTAGEHSVVFEVTGGRLEHSAGEIAAYPGDVTLCGSVEPILDKITNNPAPRT